MTLVYLSLAFMAGIAVAGRVEVAASAAFWVFPSGLALLGFLLGRKQRATRLMFGCTLLFSLGAARFALSVPRFDASDLATYNDSGFSTIEGIVVDAPDVRDKHVNLRVRAERITSDDGNSQQVSGEALVQAPLFGEYAYGDRVRVRGELQTPPEADDFSYRDYLARQGIHSLVRFTQVDVLERGQGSLWRSLLLRFRGSSQGVIRRLLPDPQSSLLSGILLGVESGIAQGVRDDFNATGATHVIAISGANLAILAGVIRGVTRRWLRSGLSAWVTVIGIFVYSLFVGGDAAVMRAFVMAAVGISGEELLRRTYAPTSLSAVALIMTAIKPLLLWDVSFLLSFFSTWGIVLYAGPLSNALERGLALLISGEAAARVVAALTESVVVTVAAQITTIPIIALFFGRFSLVSLPVNLLIIPAQAALMIIGGVATLVAFVVWPLGQIIAWVDWLYLSYTLGVVRFFADVPFASLALDVAPAVVFWFFVMLFGGTWVASWTDERRAGRWQSLRRLFGVKVLAAGGAWAAFLLAAFALSLPDGRLHVTFMDVGGSALLIRTPGGRKILVDGGGSSRELSTGLGDALPFWERSIDLIVITQPIPNHVSGLPVALERYRADALLYNGQRGASDASDALWAALEEQGVRSLIAQPGMQIRVDDGVTLTVLQTEAANAALEEDDFGQPIVMMLEHDGARFLLTGDLPPEGEQRLLNSDYNLAATILQVPWHGNQIVSETPLLEAVHPQLAVIPVASRSSTTFPHQTVLERLDTVGADVYRTDRDGTVRIATDGTRLWVWPRR